jgi:TetR/AcrR family transcriptional regulator, cholesterol catabolism regulator
VDFSEKLETKSLELFMRYGIKSISMDDIAQALGVSKKRIYQEVPNKEMLINRLLERYMHQEISAIENYNKISEDAIHELWLIATHVLSRLEMIHPVTIYDLKKYFESHWMLSQSLMFDTIYSTMLKNINRGRVEGLYLQEFKPEIVCRIYVGNSLLLFDDFIFPVEEFEKKAVYSTMITQFIRSISTQEGIKRLKYFIDKQ